MAKFKPGESGNSDAKFKPGQSGNPCGRPRSQLNALLSEYLRGKEGRKAREQKLVEKVYALALAGDLRAAALIWDRMEGKGPEQPDPLSSEPIHFVLYDPEKQGKSTEAGTGQE